MAVGYVLITAAPGTEFSIHEVVQGIEGVEDATLLFGEYDLVAKIVAPEMQEIARIVVERIRSIPGVTDTKTLAGAGF